MGDRTFVIAEAGVNHNGSLDLAFRLVDAAATAGADAVKFQTFRAASLVSRSAPKADYQVVSTGAAESQHDMIRRLELDERAHERIMAHCKERGIEFLSTPFDIDSLNLLADSMGVRRIKLSSGDLTDAPLLLACARKARPVIVSTGMSTLEEVKSALGVLAFGFVDPTGAPSASMFDRSFASPEGQGALRQRVSLLHCTTEYPAPVADVNLRAMATLASTFGLPVGYSDHTRGTTVPIAAVALGARIIEKHFTLDRGLPGPDHPASLEPGELQYMVAAIRDVELALGTSDKRPAPSELKNRTVARKSLVATRAIRRGESFTPENLAAKRPGNGVSPVNYWEWLGRQAERDYAPDEQVGP